MQYLEPSNLILLSEETRVSEEGNPDPGPKPRFCPLELSSLWPAQRNQVEGFLNADA